MSEVRYSLIQVSDAVHQPALPNAGRVEVGKNGITELVERYVYLGDRGELWIDAMEGPTVVWSINRSCCAVLHHATTQEQP